MKKSETLNVFDQGLVMDINPLVAPKDGVCNALNATLITMNGNENVLQNDMGNGRVETAYLPEGYIPLGTTELGGIIYIVSYNPSNDKCQIGCFPSPERNIESSGGESSLNQLLTNADFGFDVSDTSQGSLIYNIKKELNKNIKFNPGDKFIVYSDKISEICDQLYNKNDYLISEEINDKKELETALEKFYNKVKFHTIKLDIGTITDSGKTIKFDNLKQYVIKSDPEYKYHICQSENFNGKYKVDLDNYRSLVSQPYNIFSSKVSGQLVLLAELVQFNDFDVQIKNGFKIESIDETPESKEYKAYQLSIFASFSGDYPFVPYGIICKFDLIHELADGKIKISSTVNKQFDIDDIKGDINDIKEYLKNFSTSNYNFNFTNLLPKDEGVGKTIDDLSKNGYFETINREKCILNYTFTPCMNWGKVSHLEVKGQIDLSKIGTGYIGLNTWKYYNDSKNCNLTWGLEAYEEEDKYIKSVKIIFKRISKHVNGEAKFEETEYNISSKNSYFGIFYETIPFNQEHYKLTKPLKDNSLYLATINVTYGNDSINDIRTFKRFLYTNALFNEYYKDYQDFDSLQPKFDIDFKFDYKKDVTESSVTSYGITKAKWDSANGDNNLINQQTENSLSAIQTQRKYHIVGNINVLLKNDYNTFKLNIKKDDFTITGGTFSTTSKSTDKYTEVQDTENRGYFELKDEIYDNESTGEFSQYELLEKNYEDNSEKILKLPTNVINEKESTFELKDGVENNNYQFTLNFTALNMAKAYCIKEIKELSYHGQFIPLAYDKTTFGNYNLKWYDSIDLKIEPNPKYEMPGWGIKNVSGWLPSTVGLYGFGEGRSRDGNFWIGGWTSSKDDGDGNITEPVSAKNESNIKMNFTTNPEVITKEQSSGWTNTTMFCYYYHGYDWYNDNNGQYLSRASDHYIQNMSDVDLPQNKTVWSEGSEHPNLYADPGSYIYRYNVKNPKDPDDKIYRHLTKWRAGNSRLQLFMRSSDNQYFYPMNFSHIGPNNLDTKIPDGKDYVEDQDYGDIVFNHSIVYSLLRSNYGFYWLIQNFACFLNNIYRYSSNVKNLTMILPKYIYWMDEIEYATTYTLDITPNTNSIISPSDTNHDLINGNPLQTKPDIDIYITLDDGELQTIKEYAEKLLGPSFSEDNIPNNVNVESVNIKNANFDINIKQIDNISGKTLRDEMLNDTGSTLGTAIIDYNGKDIVGESLINVDPKRLYMRINDGENVEIKEADKFNPIKINYVDGKVQSWENKRINTVNDVETDLNLNLNRKFTLNENDILVLNSPPTTEHRFQLQHDWDWEDSEADGYQKVVLLSQYQSY